MGLNSSPIPAFDKIQMPLLQGEDTLLVSGTRILSWSSCPALPFSSPKPNRNHSHLGRTVLTIYDIKHQEYPFAVWLIFTFIALILSQLNWLFCGFLLLAYLTEKWQINIGSGDFLYLASLALICGFTELLWIIQISSLLGLLVFAIFKPKSIPYVPLLFLSSIPIILCI